MSVAAGTETKNKRKLQYKLFSTISPIAVLVLLLVTYLLWPADKRLMTYASNDSLPLLIPFIIPGIGVVIGIIGLVKSPKYWKLMALAGIVLNIIAASVVMIMFIDYSIANTPGAGEF